MSKRSKKTKKLAKTKAPVRTGPAGFRWEEVLSRGQARWVRALLIIAAGIVIYWPALHGDWLWDDDILISNNALVRDPGGLAKIWFEPVKLIDYEPITASVNWLVWQLGGSSPLYYHLLNLALHLTSALLIWHLLGRFGLRYAWLGGLLFTVHPIMVESVAWMAELKNTLSLPPFLAAMICFIDYSETGRAKSYWRALCLFLVAMLCKPTMAMFPLVILLYAWWKRGRLGWSDAKASAPFFVLAALLGAMTVCYLNRNAEIMGAIPLHGTVPRLAVAGWIMAFYFSKFFLPLNLMTIYPQWPASPPTALQFLPWLIMACLAFWLWTKRATWGRHALLGLGFFAINLLPFLGLVTGSYMAFTWVMDHILYLPALGLIGLTVAGLEQVAAMTPASLRPIGAGAVLLTLILLGVESRGYAALYQNAETLWTYNFERNPAAYPAPYNLGMILFQRGQTTAAIERFEQALRLKPDFIEARNNLGNLLYQIGQPSAAADEFREAILINPHYADARHNYGNLLCDRGDYQGALEQLRQAVRDDPNSPAIHNSLGIVLRQTGDLPGAIDQYEEAVRLDPGYYRARYNEALALQHLGRTEEAIHEFEEVLRIAPDCEPARQGLLQLEGH